MAGKTDIGPKIGIDGEKQFRDEIKAINTGLKTLGSEMRLLTSEFIGNEKSIRFLTEQNVLFESEVGSLNDKLKLQENRLVAVTRAYKEGSIQSLEAARAVFTTKAEINEINSKIQKNTDLINDQISALIRDSDAFLEELNAVKTETNAIEQNTDAIEDNVEAHQANAGAMEESSGKASSLSGILKSALTSGLQKLGGQLGLSSSQVSTLTSGLSGLSSSALSTVGPLGVTLTAVLKLTSGLVKLAEAGGKHADKINSLATNYNLTTKDVQRFQYMAELTDTSVETMTSSISSLVKSMNSARGGSGDAAKAFAQLGISVTNSDGSLRNANEVFMETIDALRQIGNATERDALIQEIFGKSALELNSIIKLGSAGLAELAEEADHSGYVMNDKMVSALQEADDAAQRLSKAGEGLKNTLGGLVAPAVADVKNGLADMTSALTWYLSGEAGRAFEKEFVPIVQSFLGLKDAADEATAAEEASGKALVSITDWYTNATFRLREYNEELERTKLAEMSLKEQRDYLIKQATDAGLGREISRYDPNTGIIWSTFVNSNDAASYRRGETTVDALYNESFTDHAARLRQESGLPPIDITLEIDGRTLARTTYDEFQSEGNRRGGKAIS